MKPAASAPRAPFSNDGRLFVWNWLPARYVCEQQWQQSLGPVPRPAPDSREELALSAWLLRRHDLQARPLREPPPLRWLWCTPDFLQAKAFVVGLASHAQALSRLMSRADLLAVREALGPLDLEQAVRLARRHPHAAALNAQWRGRLDTPSLCRTGASLMLSLLGEADETDDGLRRRFVLRMPADLVAPMAGPPLADEVRADLCALLDADADRHVDPCFDWALPTARERH